MSGSQKEKIEYDLVLVGGSPSNLSLAHHIVDLFEANSDSLQGKKLSIAILEKGEAFGAHIVSGAVVNKSIFDKVFPKHEEQKMPIEAVCNQSFLSIIGTQKKWDTPSVLVRALAPDFCKEGYYILTLSLVVEWMANTLQERIKTIENLSIDFFTGFPAIDILYDHEKVIGVKVDKSGDDLEDNVYAKAVVFADKGFISKDLIKKFNLETNPQIWSVGVKETWKLADDAPDMEAKVYHSLGYPVMDGTLGGGFIYGLKNKRLTIGLVISLDSPNPNIHPQKQLQEFKKHPWLQNILKDGELLNYGAAVLPEGGPASLPKKFQVDGAMLLGDSLGLLDVKSLAGVDKAMESGYIAAEVLFEAWKLGDYSEARLSEYQDRLMESPYLDKFKSNKYFRKAFLENPELLRDFLPDILNSIDKLGCPIPGALLVGIKNPIKAISKAFRAFQLLNEGDDLDEEIKYKPGYQNIDPQFSKDLINRGRLGQEFEKNTVYSREDAVFYSHIKYSEHPNHIDEFDAETCLRCIRKYENINLDVPCVSDCTAEVHRLDITGDNIKVHAMSLENCVQCRTCELICPEQNLRVNPAMAAGGPDFRGL
jgi:electron-transferring-flavoprotein dehydrogenase